MSHKCERHANKNWTFPTDVNGTIEGWQYVQMAILMDIRDELQLINSRLRCSETLEIPRTLRKIRIAVEARRREARKANQ